jgi:hypothetical protein
MDTEIKTIKCINCGFEINVNDVLYHQVQEQLNKEFEAQNAQKDQEYHKLLLELQEKQKQVDKDKESIQNQVDNAVKTKLIQEKTKLEQDLRKQITDEKSEQVKALENELQLKSDQLKDLNKTKSEVLRLTREKDELRDQINFEKEKEFSAKLTDERQKIMKQADEASALKIKELEHQLEVQKGLAEEMKRKADQGSMQLQGEVQELALEDMLRTMFPFDLIEEVAKGVRGADCKQTVRNRMGVDCGTILYESKRTKAFTNDWINKLKADAVAAKADICIIVSEVLPEGIERIGQKDGVWISTFNDIKGLVLVLRESLIKINDAYSSQTNKGEKMQMLYDFLISTEFRLQVGAIIEGFTDLQNSYVQEKRAMERIWKQREKQLEKVLLNTNHFIGSIKGIAGSSIPDLKKIGEGDNILEIGEQINE